MLKRPLVSVILSFILGIVFMNIKRTIFYMVLLFFVFFIIFNNKDMSNYNINSLITKEQLQRERFIKLTKVLFNKIRF